MLGSSPQVSGVGLWLRPVALPSLTPLGACSSIACAFRRACNLRSAYCGFFRVFGGVPEWLKGTGCKPVGYAYPGSNPGAPTTKTTRDGIGGPFNAPT